jgi:hypothetical protein
MKFENGTAEMCHSPRLFFLGDLRLAESLCRNVDLAAVCQGFISVAPSLFCGWRSVGVKRGWNDAGWVK